MSTRMTSAVITSPVRTSLRVRLSSNIAAKLFSWDVTAAVAAFGIKGVPALYPPSPAGLVIEDKTPMGRFVTWGFSPAASFRAPAVPAHDPGCRLRCAHVGRVEQPRVGTLLERRHAARRIARVALAQILQKAGKCSSDSLVHQLFIAPLGPGFGAGGQEYFEAGVGK